MGLYDSGCLYSHQVGTTPLHEACCYGSVECIGVLLKHRACIYIWDKVSVAVCDDVIVMLVSNQAMKISPQIVVSFYE